MQLELLRTFSLKALNDKLFLFTTSSGEFSTRKSEKLSSLYVTISRGFRWKFDCSLFDAAFPRLLTEKCAPLEKVRGEEKVFSALTFYILKRDAERPVRLLSSSTSSLSTTPFPSREREQRRNYVSTISINFNGIKFVRKRLNLVYTN